MSEWLLKFSLQEFAKGSVGFEAGSSVYFFALLLAVLVGGFLMVYTTARVYSSSHVKAVSLGIRIAALLLLCLPLFEPVLVVPDVVPDENFVAVLVDGSQSMTIPDGDGGETRRAVVDQILGDASGGIVEELEEHFQIRYYSFGDEVSRSDSLVHIRMDGVGTNVTDGLDRVMNDFRGIPLAGIVMLTDGGDNSTDVPINKAEELRDLDIPLHVVGVGRESFEEEREILDVNVTKAVEQETGAEIDVKIRSWAEELAPVDFHIYLGDEVVFSEKRRLKGGGRVDQLSFFFEPQQSGPLEYRIAVAVSEDEINDSNNDMEMLIDTKTDTMRVLYFEGALRQDFKFIKRALEDDQVVDFVSVSRTGTGKYYRQGIRTQSELAGGFPTTEEELFDFEALVFGDIEASAFSIEQLRMIERFVRVRGGGFLMMGGRTSFADGGYWDTPIAELLPVTLDPGRRMSLAARFTKQDKSPNEQGFKFVPTRDGIDSPILKLSSDARTNALRWAEMPGLTSINYLGPSKPGAVLLAQKPEDSFGDAEPLLVTQFYGKGRSTALATASTWRWQMLMDVEDGRHERFWRQLIRWQVASAPRRVNAEVLVDHPEPNQEVPLEVDVYDPRYRPLEGGVVQATVRDPFGSVQDIRFQEELSSPGTFRSTFVPKDEGVYVITAEGASGADPVGTHTQSMLVRSSKKEYHDAVLKRGFLESLADVSGGEYYVPSEADRIPINLRSRRTTSSVYRSEYLWDMPLIYGLVLLLLSVEWFYRRRRGLP